MPAGPVYHHHDVLIWVALGDLVDKQLHAAGVDLRKDQAIELSRTHIHRCIGIGALVAQHGLAHEPHGVRRPAPAHVRDTAKARLILKHQLDGFASCPVLDDFAEDFGEFFPTPLEPQDRF